VQRFDVREAPEESVAIWDLEEGSLHDLNDMLELVETLRQDEREEHCERP
jgi:hypothetical protein